MVSTGPRLVPATTPSTGVIALFLVVLSLTTWFGVPALQYFDGGLIPWPAHGMAIALMVAVTPARRAWAGLGIFVAVVVGAMIGGGSLAQSAGGSSALTGQSVVVMLAYSRFAGGAHPLSSSVAYAWFALAVLLGLLPTTLLAAALVRMIGPEFVPGFSVGVWWVAAATSVGAVTPILLAPSAPAVILRRQPRLWHAEFLAICALYLFALLNAFLLVGSSAIAIPPAVASLPFLCWAALRFGVRGYAIVAAMLGLAAVTSTIYGVGPFGSQMSETINASPRTWIFLASLVGPAMIFPVALVEREAAQERARGAYAQLAAILEGSGDLIAAVDRDLVIIAANPAWIAEFARLSGVTVRPGMRMEDALAALPDDAEESVAHWRRALGGEFYTVMRTLGDPSRMRAEFEITYGPVRDADGAVVGASQVVRNVTERRRREAEEGEARRLESVGRLAGGVAHDFNNLMTAVIGYAELIGSTLDKADPRRADLHEIERAASRAGELTQQLLAFARQRVVEPRVVDIGLLVEGFSRLLAPLLGPNITLLVRSEPGLRLVRLDPTQFEQVVMNLAVNARDAMPGGGKLTIETANDVRGDTKGVRLTVRDTGTGMPPEVQARLWEPFFTTKPIGQGTGLGLPTVHGIVHQAGGVIDVHSKVGEGTVFHVFLPATEAA